MDSIAHHPKHMVGISGLEVETRLGALGKMRAQVDRVHLVHVNTQIETRTHINDKGTLMQTLIWKAPNTAITLSGVVMQYNGAMVDVVNTALA